MQNVQNAAEIQQRVINLVELYRTKVGKESKKAKEAKAERDFWDEKNINTAIKLHEDGFNGPFDFDLSPEMPEERVKSLRVNDHLLGHFYSKLAGNNADEDALKQFLADYYDASVFTADEEEFLCSHFKEMVNYIILTPCDDLDSRFDGKVKYTIPDEVLELVASRISIPKGAAIYNPFTGFAQFTRLYPGHKFYCEDSYEVLYRRLNAFWKAVNESYIKFKSMGFLQAWMKVVLYANNVDVEVVENGGIPPCYDAMLSFLPEISKIEENEAFAKARKIEGLTVASKIASAYCNLKDGGVMGLLVPCNQLYENEQRSPQFKAFLDSIIRDGDMAEIIHLPQVMSNNVHFNSFCLIIAKKACKEKKVTFIDAQSCFQVIENSKSFDLTNFNTILKNDGKHPNTGLRKVVKVSSEELSSEILIPQVYVIERPSEAEHPVPLSTLCSLASTRVRDVQFDLPEDTPWITMSDLTPLYTGDLDLSAVRRADCQNNPPYVKGSKDYAFDKDGKFIDSFWEQKHTDKALRVLEYRSCTFLEGNCDAVLYDQSAKSGLQVAVVRATGRPYAISSGILVFCPKDDFDANSLAALLRLPVVYRQLIAYQAYGLGNHLNDILVPTDKRIIGDELYRMKREESVTNELGDKVQAMKTEYINEVRMRKHDMGQKVFDLINTEDLMRYYVENRETESDLWPQIEEQLDHFRKTIHELSDMLDQLSQEEHFGNPEIVDLNDYFGGLQHSSNVNGFKLSYQLDRDSILDLQLSRMKDKDEVDISSIKAMPTVFISKNDLQRVVSNILTNAQKHGFVNPNHKDYEVIIRLEFNAEKGMYQIDFRNNGQPLPEGLNKMRYGIKGEKAGQTAGTGLGGSVVKSIVEHYKGDYDVFMDGEWTVIRVYLPIAI